jgi:hypothetical protein
VAAGTSTKSAACARPRPSLPPRAKRKENGETRVRDYFANDPVHLQTYSACALLVGSAVSKVLANFFMGLNKPKKPTRMFTSQDEAIHWLEGYRRGATS